MSDERNTLNAGPSGTSTSVTPADDRREANNPGETPAQKRARLVSVLSRGVISDRLHVQLPPGVYGEWVRNDPLEIHRLESIGFSVDTEYASKRGLHTDGANGAIVGDLIFMVTDQETKNIIDDIRQQEFMKANMSKSQREEADFQALQRASGADGTISESRTTVATKDSILEALRPNK